MTGGFGNPLPNHIGNQIYGQHWQANQAVHCDPNALARAQQMHAFAAQQAAAVQALTGFPGILAGAFESEPEPENEGIKLGEIIAWRAWTVCEGWLYSVTANKCEWAPGATIEADKIDVPAGAGIHAFKTRRAAIEKYGGGNDRVVGQVALWGEIIEFEDGYHAEFAKVHSLDWTEEPMYTPTIAARIFRGHRKFNRLEQLQARYGVGYAVL